MKGPQCDHRRDGDARHRRHRAFDGHRSHRLIFFQPQRTHLKEGVEIYGKTVSKRIRSPGTSLPAQEYPLERSGRNLARFPKAKFDETVELSDPLGVDPRQSTQMVRGTVNLPKGSGKKVRVIAFTDNPQQATRRRR
jgi:hypothetical protein